MSQFESAEDEKTKKQSAKHHEFIDAQINKAFLELLASSHGGELIWWLLQTGQLHTNPYCQGDPHQTSFNTGALNVGNQILVKILEANPKAYVQLMESKANDRRSNNSTGDTTGSAD